MSCFKASHLMGGFYFKFEKKFKKVSLKKGSDFTLPRNSVCKITLLAGTGSSDTVWSTRGWCLTELLECGLGTSEMSLDGF